jgi:hypothetical protein
MSTCATAGCNNIAVVAAASRQQQPQMLRAVLKQLNYPQTAQTI